MTTSNTSLADIGLEILKGSYEKLFIEYLKSKAKFKHYVLFGETSVSKKMQLILEYIVDEILISAESVKHVTVITSPLMRTLLSEYAIRNTKLLMNITNENLYMTIKNIDFYSSIYFSDNDFSNIDYKVLVVQSDEKLIYKEKPFDLMLFNTESISTINTLIYE